jgi:hypothetical protein
MARSTASLSVPVSPRIAERPSSSPIEVHSPCGVCIIEYAVRWGIWVHNSQLKEDAAGHVYVAGLAEVAAATPAEALEAYHRGIANRHRAETQLNLQSSRSHCIFTVTLCAGGPDGASRVPPQKSIPPVALGVCMSRMPVAAWIPPPNDSSATS